MSITNITDAVRLKVWVKAGGRCQYRNCNKPLWRDDLSLRAMNIAYLAHIVADSESGPRGDPILSDQLKSEFSNIMLLCDVHHRLVDREGLVAHSVELLRQFKAEHEERIERSTGIISSRKTEVLLFATRIGDRAALPTFEQVQDVTFPERYPASERGLPLLISKQEIREGDNGFWEYTSGIVERTLSRLLADGVGPADHPLNHLSVFALAPIPLLVHFGKCLGDVVPADVYQRNRLSEDWRWRDLDDPEFRYIVTDPPQPAGATQVVVCLSLSGVIHDDEIIRAMGGTLPTYTITHENPRRDYLIAKEQLELFRVEWTKLLARIRENCGPEVEVHVFPAVPNSVAVEMGRALLPKADPPLLVYDHDRGRGGFRHVMTI